MLVSTAVNLGRFPRNKYAPRDVSLISAQSPEVGVH